MPNAVLPCHALACPAVRHPARPLLHHRTAFASSPSQQPARTVGVKYRGYASVVLNSYPPFLWAPEEDQRGLLHHRGLSQAGPGDLACQNIRMAP